MFGSGFFKFGPQFTLINLTYKGVEEDEKIKDSSTTAIIPAFNFSFELTY